MRTMQAHCDCVPYIAVMGATGRPDSMLYWLARSCSAAREAKGRKLVHVAASADLDQSTIMRFEGAMAWPRDTDHIVSAYADDLEMPAIQLWQDALELWKREGLEPPDATEPLVQEHEKRSGKQQQDDRAASGS